MDTQFERRADPLLSRSNFLARLSRHALLAIVIIGAALGIGMAGYHYFEGLTWLDSFLNASMILGGMGPVDVIHSTGGKIFAGSYALFSGIIFLVIAGLLFSPLIHRLLHHFHIDEDSE